MPALVLFNRRTIFGGDDLQPTCIITIFIRIIQILLLCIPILHYTITHILQLLSSMRESERENGIESISTSTRNSTALVLQYVYHSFQFIRRLLDDDTSSYTMTDVYRCRSSNRTSISTTSTGSAALYNVDNSDSANSHNSISSTYSYLQQQEHHHQQKQMLIFYILLTIWCSGTILHNLCSIVLERYIMYYSNYGTPTTFIYIRNRHIQQLLYIKLIPFTAVILLLWCIAVFGTLFYFIIPQYYYCHYHKSNNEKYNDNTYANYDNYETHPTTIVSDTYTYTTDMYVGTNFDQQIDEPIRTGLFWVAIIIMLLSQIIEIIVAILFIYQLHQIPSITGTNNMPTTTTGTSMSRQSRNRNDPLGYNSWNIQQQDHEPQYQEQHQLNYNHELVEQMWAQRCTSLCHCLSISTCYMFGGRNLLSTSRTATSTNGGNMIATTTTNATSRSITSNNNNHNHTATIFVDIARALADFLESRGVLDIVPSDIVTGLIILQRLQRQRIYLARQQYKTATTTTSYINSSYNNQQQRDEVTSNMSIERTESGILDTTTTTTAANSTSLTDSSTTIVNDTTLGLNTMTKTIRKRSSSKNLSNIGHQSLTGNDDNGVFVRRSRSKSPDDTLLIPLEEGTAIVSNSSHRNLYHNIKDDEDSRHKSLPIAITNTSRQPRQQQLPHIALHSVYRINPGSNGYQREERALLNKTDFHELYLLDEAARYAKYALAIYTWVLYLYEHPLSGPFRLLFRNSATLCCQYNSNKHGLYEQPTDDEDEQLPHQQQYVLDEALQPNILQIPFIDENGRIDGDNLCQTHKNAILLTAGIQDADIVYVQLRSSLSDIPYCILLDHEWKSIVISIRGTFSIEDCITDVLISPESLDELGNDFGFDAADEYCHGGVMSCARNVYRDLERHNLLEKLLHDEQAIYAGYILRIVGHSLGAATSTLLSYMLKRKFPNLRCINYSPPGCTFTWKMATQCKDWCTSCVLDTDLVPRLTVESIERLRDEVLDIIGRIKVPKSVVAQRFTESTFRICNDDYDTDGVFNDDLKDVLYDIDGVPDSEYQQQLLRFKEIQDERRRHRGTTRSIQLFPPGRVLHIVKTGERRSCTAGLVKILTCCTTNVGSTYVPVWINNDDLNEIVVGPRMGTDHFPNRIRSILEEVANSFGL